MSITDEIWRYSAAIADQTIKRSTEERPHKVERWTRIFAERYGVDGEEHSSLQAVGEKHGLTRERVRQITTKMLNHAAGIKIETPFLDQLRGQINQHTPATVDNLNRILRGLLGSSLSVRDAQRFAAEVLGKKVVHLIPSPFKQSTTRAQVAIDGESHADMRVQIRKVRHCVIRMIGNTGAAQVHFITGLASAELSRPLSVAEVTRWCEMTPNFEWLDRKTGWFWTGPQAENRLYLVVKKQLVAAQGRMDISDIHAGMSASVRANYTSEVETKFVEAPAAILAQVLSRVPWLEIVQHNDVRFFGEVDTHNALSTVEQSIVDLIRERHTVASKLEIEKHVVENKVATAAGVAMTLGRSPIFLQLGRGLYAVRGTTIDPKGLAIALQRVGGESRGVMITSDDDGETLTWPLTITESAFKNRHRVRLPSMLARTIEPGTYQLLKPRAEIRIVITKEPSNSYAGGLAVALLRAGCKAGQSLQLHVNRRERTISLVETAGAAHGSCTP